MLILAGEINSGKGTFQRKNELGVRLGWTYQAGLIRIQPHREVL